ncbi:MAG: alpha/beta hydrolase [Bacillus subtilis]|nr:alpha/beta hydrolase [Bacillus subtilis]
MKRLWKFLRGILIVLAVLIVGVVIAFYRADIAFETLEETYFTSNSNYLVVTLETLEDTEIELRIHYIDNALTTEKTVVLLHGLFASAHTFEAWTTLFENQGYRVVAIDLPGFGLSDNFPDQISSTRRQASVVKAVLDHLNIDRAVLGGNSMGGGIAWYFASEYHEPGVFDVEGLVLIDAVYPFAEEDREQGGFLFALLDSPIGGFLAKLTPRFLFAAILRGVYGSATTIDDATIDRYYDLLLAEGHRVSIVKITMEEPTGLTGLERLNLLKDWAIPVLVLWGEEDSWIPKEVALAFQETLDLPSDRVIVYPGLGHVPMEEDPTLTGADVLAFLVTLEGGE